MTKWLVLVVLAPHVDVADDEQSVHCSGHRDVYSIRCSQEAGRPGFGVGAGKAQNDDSIFLALVAIHSVDLHQLLEAFIPNFLVELLPYQPLLFCVHTDYADKRIVPFLEFGQVCKELTTQRNVFEDFDYLLSFATVVDTADSAVSILIMMGPLSE